MLRISDALVGCPRDLTPEELEITLDLFAYWLTELDELCQLHDVPSVGAFDAALYWDAFEAGLSAQTCFMRSYLS